MKIATIVGNRPQFIKTALLSKKIREFADEIYINTGQHYDHEMAEVFFEELDLPQPHYNLGVVANTSTKQVGEILIKLEGVLRKEKPDLVLVFGDTNTTLAGALAGSIAGIPVAHVEAGLRSYDDLPEETIRVAVDHLSDYHFCPTETAVSNLAKEGIKGIKTGDVLAELITGVRIPKDYTLATIHRQSNVDDEKTLRGIIRLLKEEDRVIFPMHPRTRKMINKFKIDTKGLEIIKPVSFKEMIDLERKAKRIITDSGGVMREAYLLGVPCEVLRERTEWEELKGGEEGLLGYNASNKICEVLCSIK